MGLKNTKLFIGTLILLAYISIGIFGLFQFNSMAGMPMAHCPYALDGFSVCNNSLDHIDHWKKFSNTTFTPLFIFSLLILGLILYTFIKRSLLNKELLLFYKWKYYIDSKIFYAYLEKIVKWLSLFENSPPVNDAFL